MKLRKLEIQHVNYYSDKPTTDRYEGKISFFNEKGEGLTVVLREDQLLGIVELCANGMVKAAQEATQSIVASLNPILQIEGEHPSRESDNA
jgi:hypothetical protein